MADIVNINEIVIADVVKVNDIAKADIVNINDMATTTYLIDPTLLVLELDNQGTDSASSSIDVTPDAMNTTATRINTGDGTLWFLITAGSTGTGDFTLTIETNGTPTEQLQAAVDISDDAGNADTVRITVNFSYQT